ncbi:hypothetical protein CLRAG_22540 [Clostridium ragsdalei P11]|uniref:Response receiver domain-containing protein n=1 Tax=Clostridium ragsdalei P11 TaxID=1353534 RepID=A0A1A6ASF0_9CLOT|nr:hypothetical protein [Clostridium ragsdalei]OBR92960.1 hypothetical protein CLRAG_22540 [Clostridium ragsdalei P11]
MELSNSQKVIIIDDEYEEAKPLIKCLAIKGIPSIYWDGGYENTPKAPLKGVRLVFLDMRFSAVYDERNINTFLFHLLQKAISIDNGPYILFIWSKHDSEYLESFKKDILIEKQIASPYLILNMEKNKFIEQTYEKNSAYYEIASAIEEKGNKELLKILKDNIDKGNEKVKIKDGGIEKLASELDKKLKNMNSLSILLLWEKLVNVSAQNLIKDISDLSDNDKCWDNNIKTLIRNLARANGGKALEETPKGYITNAIQALNEMLSDELWNSLIREDINQEEFSFIKEPSIKKIAYGTTYSIYKSSKGTYCIKKDNSDYITFKDISSLSEMKDKEVVIELYEKYLSLLAETNFKLLCENTGNDNVFAKLGGLYLIENKELLKEICRSSLKNIDQIKNIKLVKLDISSACDYAQNKLKRIRVLYGIIIEKENFNAVQSTEDIYCTPLIKLDKKIVKIVFNFHYISNQKKDELDTSAVKLFFRELLLNEIKHRLSSYISRVGIINL